MMSIPSPYSQRGGSDPREDCRDYLRTGRCKYGASCKYNHPPNVQSGGGMKAPIDPSEPMFPVRPNEPVCQYYMKHGTCKFGQACKFHHPPQAPGTTALVGGATVVMNVGRKNDTSQILMNQVGTDSNGSPMMLQFLPQRPDEPDCIFFLKNGRCKYGATCRYHHPVNFHQRRQDDGRRQRSQMQQVNDGMINNSKVPPYIAQSVCQTVPQHKYPQGCVMADGSLALMGLDGGNATGTNAARGPKGSYQQLSVNMGNDGGTQYCHQSGMFSMNPDHNSSSSTVSSSYDTASSNLQIDVGQGDPPNSLWNRQNNSAHVSVNTFTTDSPVPRSHLSSYAPRSVLSQSTSDGNLTSVRRHRSASYGSVSDHTSYLDSNGHLSRSMHGSNSINTARTWRTERSPSYDGTIRRTHHNQYLSNDITEKDNRPNFQSTPLMRTTTPRQKQETIQQPIDVVDDGLSMMTSALLNMLDTPEKVSIGKHNSAPKLSAGIDNEIGGIRTEMQAQFNRRNTADVQAQFNRRNTAEMQTQFNRNTTEVQGQFNRNTTEVPAQFNRNTTEVQAQFNRNTTEVQAQFNRNTTEVQAQFNRNTLLANGGAVAEQRQTMPMFFPQEPLSRGLDKDFLYGRVNTLYEDASPSFFENEGSWFPPWHQQTVDHACRPLDENAQSMSLMQPPHTATGSPHHATAAPNLGLFLS